MVKVMLCDDINLLNDGMHLVYDGSLFRTLDLYFVRICLSIFLFYYNLSSSNDLIGLLFAMYAGGPGIITLVGSVSLVIFG